MKNLVLGIVLVIAFSVVFSLGQEQAYRSARIGVSGLAGTLLAFGFLCLAKAARERRGNRP